MLFAEGIWWKRTAGGPLGKLTCIWEVGVYFEIKAKTGEVIAANRNGVWLTRTIRRKTARERWDRSNLEMIVTVPWRKNEDDAQMDGQVVMMDKDNKEKLEEPCCVPKRVYVTREDLEVFRLATRRLGYMSFHKRTAREARTENCRKLIEEELRGVVKAGAAHRRVQEYQDKAAERSTKGTKPSLRGRTDRCTSNNNNNPIWGGSVSTGEELPLHSGESYHALSQVRGPTHPSIPAPCRQDTTSLWSTDNGGNIFC